MKMPPLLAAVLLASAARADEPVDVVQAKVIFGSGTPEEAGEVDAWIAKPVADAGSPFAGAYTEWFALGGEAKELYASEMGGRLIKASATNKAGNFEVVISGFKITPLTQTIVLRAGERRVRVVKLTDYAAPENVFIALTAPPSKRALRVINRLRPNAKTFRLDLDFHGDEDKPFYRMTLNVPEIEADGDNPFFRRVQISEAQAAKLIEYLVDDGFFDRSGDPHAGGAPRPRTDSYYTLTVTAGNVTRQGELGWGGKLLARLDALHAELEGDADSAMELLGRLSGYRREWEAKMP